jgi:hypothetical protein
VKNVLSFLNHRSSKPVMNQSLQRASKTVTWLTCHVHYRRHLVCARPKQRDESSRGRCTDHPVLASSISSPAIVELQFLFQIRTYNSIQMCGLLGHLDIKPTMLSKSKLMPPSSIEITRSMVVNIYMWTMRQVSTCADFTRKRLARLPLLKS